MCSKNNRLAKAVPELMYRERVPQRLKPNIFYATTAGMNACSTLEPDTSTQEPLYALRDVFHMTLTTHQRESS